MLWKELMMPFWSRDGRECDPAPSWPSAASGNSHRLHAVLRRHDRNGEQTIAAAQALLCGFLVAYHMPSPGRALAEGAGVTLAIVLLLASSIIRFLLARRTPLPERALDALTATDVGMFVAVVWMLQTAAGLPGSVALRSPTLWMILPLVALRALRYDHRQLLVGGITAFLLCGGLVLAEEAEPALRVASAGVAPIGAGIERLCAIVALVAVLSTAAWGARAILSEAAHAEDYAEALALAQQHLAAATTARRETDCAIAALREREAEVSRRNALFAAAIANMSQGLCMTDGDRRLVVTNDRFLEIYGLTPDEARPGMPACSTLDSAAARMRLPADGRRALEGDGDPIVVLGDGRVVAVRARPIAGGGAVVTHEDITELRRSEAQLAHLAYHDALTGLANRTQLIDRLHHIIDTAGETDGAVLLALLDVQRFRDINHSHGPDCGDALLRIVGQRLRGVSGVLCVARIGDDEFAAVFVEPSSRADGSSVAIADQIMAEVTRPAAAAGATIEFGISLGLARAPDDAADADALVKTAELALAGAKAQPGAGYRFFEARMDDRSRRRRQLSLDLKVALDAGQFEVRYQPQLDLATGRIVGFEALIRWHHPAEGLVSPAEFIPLAEEIGLMRPIGSWVLERACRDAAQWPDRVRLSVNLSAHEICPALVERLVEVLGETKIAAGRLELEITETALIEDTAVALAVLQQLKALGVRIALDDFGTGYASLSYLRLFPFDKIKVDRSFLDGLGNPGNSALGLLVGIGNLAACLDMTSTVEGIEDWDQLACLTAGRFTEIQGYLLSRPLPAAQLAPFLAADFRFESGPQDQVAWQVA